MSNNALRDTWGIADGYWLWPTRIKILFVIDGRVELNKGAETFGLGYVLDTLAAPSTWWVDFRVDVAKRDGCLDEAALGGFALKYSNFRFTQPGFELDDYDQIWLFGDQPSEDDGDEEFVTDGDIAAFALDNAEVKRIAEWMDRGGGVFATGDHTVLGASLCSRIPRVRTMRRWTFAQGVPPAYAVQRHETLQPPSYGEGDQTLQPIELVRRRAGGPLPFLGPLLPHPVLTSTLGEIDRFPDHMHEGEVVDDDAVQLDAPLGIAGYNRPEYPSQEFEVAANVSAATLPLRPRPRVIAYGRTTNLHPPTVIANVTSVDVDGGFLGFHKRFGLVGAYDGDAVGIGRVIVDSTWHHWFSMNLGRVAFGGVSIEYRKMQAFYRNVGIWLATPAQRRSMLVSAVWGVLTGSQPMAFRRNDSPWRVGERALATLRATCSNGMLNELTRAAVSRPVQAAISPARAESETEPACRGLPEQLMDRAVVGSIGCSLLDLAFDHRNRRARGERPRLNADALRRQSVDGIARGRALLRTVVKDAAAAFKAAHDELTELDEPRPVDVRIPIELRRLRVIAEALQPEANDPALASGSATVTIRLRRDDDIVTPIPCETFHPPSFEVRAGLNELSREIGEIEVQSGESLSIDVLLARPGAAVEADALRFTDTLRGDVSEWIGKRAPARTHAWRLWYRIEQAEAY